MYDCQFISSNLDIRLTVFEFYISSLKFLKHLLQASHDTFKTFSIIFLLCIHSVLIHFILYFLLYETGLFCILMKSVHHTSMFIVFKIIHHCTKEKQINTDELSLKLSLHSIGKFISGG